MYAVTHRGIFHCTPPRCLRGCGIATAKRIATRWRGRGRSSWRWTRSSRGWRRWGRDSSSSPCRSSSRGTLEELRHGEMISSFSSVHLIFCSGVVFSDEKRAADVRTRGAFVEHPSLSGRTPVELQVGCGIKSCYCARKRYRFACS